MKKLITILSLVALSATVFGQTNSKIKQQEYVDEYKDVAIREMKLYGVPASITLAQGLLESASGTSKLAVKANNHFGIKCHLSWDGPTFYQDDDTKNECFRKYKNPEKSFKDHSLFLTTRDRYSFLFDLRATDYKAWAQGLKDAGYATNPKYPGLLISLIERYNLNQYDMTEADLLAQNSLKPKHGKREKDPEVKKVHKKSEKVNFVDVGGEPPIFDVNGHPTDFKGPRKVYLKNQVKCIVARKQDSFMKIANDLDMLAWQIYKYNDLSKGDKIKAGQLIYIKPKKSQYRREGYHQVQKGETLHHISQHYGVKVKSLLKLNGLTPTPELSVGQKIKLNKHSGLEEG